jgi:hypothetical protein
MKENPKTSANPIWVEWSQSGMNPRGRVVEYVRLIRVAMHATNQP